MHIYDEVKNKYKSVANSNLRFAIKEDIYPIYENFNHELFEECNDFFKINKENMLDIQKNLRISYKMFLENCKLEYDVNDVHTFYKTLGQSQTLKADVLKYFYNNKEFKNDEFWHIFLENIDDDISKNYIMKGYY